MLHRTPNPALAGLYAAAKLLN
ncbi:protein of unknown function [Azospirillum lipoferum 4B]|uniref:Uncharacterized protein n=1 Tax=Azospirillum lipoferum (strain 4B) TaxID=862719 RepID=G7Z5J9_AZOL4|nr:protein of unknown function [Azospirillum lipoferum 4B]